MASAGKGLSRTGWALLLLSLLSLNACWLSARRHAGFRKASLYALDSLAYLAEETRSYHAQMAQMLFHADGQPIDTFTLTDPDGVRCTFGAWVRACHPELLSGMPASGMPPGLKETGGAAEDADGGKAPFVVVFRYTELHCMTCTERQIELMKEVRQAYPGLACVILTTYTYEAFLWQFVRMNQIDMPVYQIPSSALYGDAGVPFFFVLDASMRIQHLFVPDKAHEDWTTEYLTALGKRLPLR